jgi:DNA-binding CsgD family transcriptional regulator
MQFGVLVGDYEHHAMRFLAKLQQVQDQYSRYFSVSIRIVGKNADDCLTVESNGSPLCMGKRCESGSFCQAYCSRILGATDALQVQVYTCPYGQLLAMGRLSMPSRYLPSPDSDSICHLITVDRMTLPTEDSCDADPLSSLMNDTNAQRRIDFIERAKVIHSAFSLAFDCAGDGPGSDGGERIDRDRRAKILKCLTKRELDVLRLVCTGQSNQQIAEQLVISEHTVKLHIGNILRKTGLANRTQLAILGLELF